jgi:predicted dehydrogenase
MSQMNKPTRRSFLKGSAAVVAGSTLLGNLGIGRSAHAAGNEVIKVCLIGAGGRGRGAIRNCLNADKGLKCVAIADAFEDQAKAAAEGLRKEEQYKAQLDLPNERIFWGLDSYKKAIDCGVDLVVTAAPPGFRPDHYAYAVKAGKHVFMEKPCCTDAPGFRKLMEANKLADEQNLKVGVGLQRHHQSSYLAGIQDIRDGKLGEILYLRAYWNGGPIWLRERKPGMTEMEYQVRNWYHFTWAGGDNILEQHVHNIDVCNWVMDDHPIEANGMGGCQVRNARNLSQIFDHHAVEFTYKNGVKMFSQCRQIAGCSNNVSEAAHGTKGSSSCQRNNGPTLESGNPYDQEHIDLLKAIRGNAKYNEGWYGATSSMTAVLGRMATYSGQIVKWDDAVAKGPNEFPDVLAWDANPKFVLGPDGLYPMPIPGVYKAY